MTESLTKSDNKQKSVVLLEYPRKGLWAVGFATKENEGLIKNKVNEDIINVFVHTTPNPTSFFLLKKKKKDLIFLDVSFEQASKFIVSAGTTNIDLSSFIFIISALSKSFNKKEYLTRSTLSIFLIYFSANLNKSS